MTKKQGENNKKQSPSLKIGLGDFISLTKEIDREVATVKSDFIHIAIDEINNDPRVRYKTTGISCRKGCSYCCSSPIHVSLEEAHGALMYFIGLPNHQKDFVIQNVKNNEWGGKCCFLDANDECLIYKARPIVCRTHHVISPPLYCSGAIPGASIAKLSDFEKIKDDYFFNNRITLPIEFISFVSDFIRDIFIKGK